MTLDTPFYQRGIFILGGFIGVKALTCLKNVDQFASSSLGKSYF